MLTRRIQKCTAPNADVSEEAEEALAICDAGDSFDVMIIDQFMEEAGGLLVGTDVIARMRHIKEDSPIIGCSGNDLASTFYATYGTNLCLPIWASSGKFVSAWQHVSFDSVTF